MLKPTLLYASPLPPHQSGVADYSRWLIEALAEFFEITLYVENNDVLDPYLRRFPVLSHGHSRIDFKAFDHRLYQIGNNPWYHGYIYEACMRHPGWVVLHEFVLYYLVIGLYRDRPDFYRRLFRIGGAQAVAEVRAMVRKCEDLLQFRHPERVPLSAELLASGNRIFVHSDYTRRLVEQAVPRASVYKTEHLLPEGMASPAVSREQCLARLGIPPEAVVVASFGFVAPTKLNDVACRAVQRLVDGRNAPLYYVMVGKGEYVNSYLNDRIKITGYVSEEHFNEYVACADLILNTRYPVMGETSGPLLRAFAHGRPCIVTDVGWFSELPDNVVLKLDVSRMELIEEYLYEALDIFLDSPGPFQKMGEEAARHVRRYHTPAVVARQFFDYMVRP